MLVLRFTSNPRGDIERGWSGFMGVAWKTALAAANELLVNGHQNLDHEDIEDMEEVDLIDLLQAHGFDVRRDDEAGLYRHVHHEGLSCWKLDAATIEAAIIEAPGAGAWFGFGQQTMGKVSYICSVPGLDSAHIFECEWVRDED